MGRSAAALSAVLVLAACGGEAGEAPPSLGPGAATVATAARPGRREDACPLTVDGVRADIETTGRGSSVTLMASPDQLMLLRARAHAVQDTAAGILGACPCGAMGDAGAQPAADVSVDDIEGGARIVVAARDPSDSRALGKLVRTQLSLVHGGECR